MLDLVWHEKYLDYDFGPNHPFNVARAKNFFKLLDKEKITYKIWKPEAAKDEQILLVHTKKHLDYLKRKAKEDSWITLDTKINEKILEASYYYVGGTILAFDLILNKGKKFVFNLLGGLHHASKEKSEGFCIFNDHAIAIKYAQKQKWFKKAIVLDLDVHAGNGTQDVFYDDESVFTISLHQDPLTLYPGRCFEWEIGKGKGKGFNWNVIFEPGINGKEYLKKLDFVLRNERLLNYDASILVLVFGADTFKDDPLASLNLSLEDYFEMGNLVRNFIDNKKIPLVMLGAGGYSEKVPEIWLNFLKGLGNV